MLRVIRETRPLWVIGENVAGITNMVQPGSETDVETKSDQDEENYKERYLSKNISSIPSATILNVKDIPSNRSLFQLAVSERHINGIGYGSLLPTVQTQGLKVCDKDGKTRFMDLSSLPKQGIKYGDLLPTPVASDHTGSCTIRKMTKSNGAPRTDSLRNMPAVIGMDGDRLNGRVFQLSPLFVEEMMGYPLMWTTLPFLTGNGEKNQ